MCSDLLISDPYLSVYYVMISYNQQHGLWSLGFWSIFERLLCDDKLRLAEWALISLVLILIRASIMWLSATFSSMGSDLLGSDKYLSVYYVMISYVRQHGLCLLGSDPYLSVYYVMISYVQQHGLWSIGFCSIFERLLCDDKLRPTAWALICWVLIHIWTSIMWW